MLQDQKVSAGLITLLVDACLSAPQRVLVKFDGIAYSACDVLCRSLFLASMLADSHEGGVALYFPNHIDFITSFFAASALGRTIIPINPLLKASEIEHILADCQASTLVFHQSLRHEVESAMAHLGSVRKLVMISDERSVSGAENLLAFGQGELSAGSEDRLEPVLRLLSSSRDALDFLSKLAPSVVLAPQANDDCLIVYTSGTTGKPKGAVLSFGGVSYTLDSYPTRFPLSKADRMLAMLPFCHLYGLLVALVGSIKAGCPLVVMRHFDAETALDLIEAEKITVLSAVPAMYQFICLAQAKRARDISSLRLVTCGAAALPRQLHERVEAELGVPVLEGYALTESTVIATLNPLETRKFSSVGPAFPGGKIVCLDESGKILSSGAENVGEVCLAGPHIMKGYFRNPEATSECFQDGWFHTGDLGYLDEDGYLYIVGRKKELIVRGGMNIYPREIEDVLHKHPAVADAAVVGIPDQFMGERVKAYVVLKAGASITTESLKEYVAERLAEYKVPRLIEFIDCLPRNSTGKVLKRLLV